VLSHEGRRIGPCAHPADDRADERHYRYLDRRAEEARDQEHDEERPERLYEKPVEREKRVRRARHLAGRERVDTRLEPGNNTIEHGPIIRKAGRNRETETRLPTVTGY